MSFSLQGKTATVFGGTGFVGRYVVAALAKAGATVRVVTRHQQSAYFLRTNGVVGQIVPVSSTYRTKEEIDRDVQGSDVVVNCTGILFEKRKNQFHRVHADIPQWIAEACARHSVKRFVHISALGVDIGQSDYAKSKLAGEAAVIRAFPLATILRPSAIFGPEDNFFNMFASLARILPAMPLVGGGKTKFQPVFVGDVAAAVLAALTQVSSLRGGPQGRIYELGGPEILTLREIYERIFEQTGRKRMMVTLPWGLARIQAAFLSILPTPPLTNDQITSLQTDSVVGQNAAILVDLGIHPTGLDVVLPGYLDRFRPGGRFAEKKRA